MNDDLVAIQRQHLDRGRHHQHAPGFTGLSAVALRAAATAVSYTLYSVPANVTIIQGGTINNAGENIGTGVSTTGEGVFLYWGDPSQPPTLGTSPSGTSVISVGRINQVGAFVLNAVPATSPSQIVSYLYEGATFRKLLPLVNKVGLPAVNDFGQVSDFWVGGRKRATTRILVYTRGNRSSLLTPKGLESYATPALAMERAMRVSHC